MKDFPKKLFVIRKEEGTEDEYFQADETFDCLPDFGEKVNVGVYEYKSTAVAENKTMIVV